MSNLDPYAEIEKVPLFTSDNMKSKGYSIRIENDKADSGWSEVGLVSNEYLLVPNRQVRDMALEIVDRTALTWYETKVFFDGKRFMYALATDTALSVEVNVGDVISVGLLFENSYDGSRKLAASLFAYRLVCSNGLLIPQYFARMRFNHDNSAKVWEAEVGRALAMISYAEEGLERFANGARILDSVKLGSTELKAFRQGVLDKLPTTLWGKVVDRYLLAEDHTAWGLLNAGTNICWHNEKGTVQDFNHNEYITSSMINYAMTELVQRPLSLN